MRRCFSLRDLEIAAGDVPAPAAADGAPAPPSLAAIDGAAMEADLAGLDETAKALNACVESLKGLEEAISSRVDAAAAASFGKLPALLYKANQYVSGKLAQRTAAGADGAPPRARWRPTAAAAPRRPALSAAPSTRARTSSARSTPSARTTRRNEPSSPIPMFMGRSKKLVMMSFVDLIKELVPEGLSKVDMLRGQTEG